MKKNDSDRPESKVPVHFRLRPDIARRLKAEAERLGYEQTAFVESALDECLSKIVARLEKERLRMIKEGPKPGFEIGVAA